MIPTVSHTYVATNWQIRRKDTQLFRACFLCSCPWLLFFLVILKEFLLKKTKQQNCTRSHGVQRIKLEPFSSLTIHYAQSGHGGSRKNKQGDKSRESCLWQVMPVHLLWDDVCRPSNPPGYVSRSTLLPRLHRQHHITWHFWKPVSSWLPTPGLLRESPGNLNCKSYFQATIRVGPILSPFASTFSFCSELWLCSGSYPQEDCSLRPGWAFSLPQKEPSPHFLSSPAMDAPFANA